MSTVPFDLNYSPLESEIYERAEALRWMVRTMGWEWELVDLIFIEDSPSLDLVRALVYKHGPDEAKRRLRLFMESDVQTPPRITQEGPENYSGMQPPPYITDIPIYKPLPDGCDEIAASQSNPARPEGK